MPCVACAGQMTPVNLKWLSPFASGETVPLEGS